MIALLIGLFMTVVLSLLSYGAGIDVGFNEGCKYMSELNKEDKTNE